MMLGLFNENVIADKIDQIFWEGELDFNLLRTTYLMDFIRSIQVKKNIDHIFTAQLSIMYKIKYSLNLLKFKNDVPFEMGK